MRDKANDATNCQKVVTIVQGYFRHGTISNETTWKTVVLIFKGGSGDFRGIGLVEVLLEDGHQSSEPTFDCGYHIP